MNYTLELNTQDPGSNVVFNNIVFDSFKVNIVERHTGSMRSRSKLNHVLFKVRTLDNTLIQTKDGNGRIKIKEKILKCIKRQYRFCHPTNIKTS
jgi:hypothetical protein